MEAIGALELRGAALPAGGPPTTTARLLLKTPGRARLELLPADAADGERPAAMVKEERLAGRGRAGAAAGGGGAGARAGHAARPGPPAPRARRWATAW